MSRPAGGEQRRLRLPVRVFNRVGSWAAALGRKPPSFRALEATLHEAASRAAGSDDFGDQRYREGLRVLLAAYDEEARLSPWGRMMVRNELVRILRNRALAEAAWKSAPGLGTGEVRRPLFILGLPRTGTTALHHLLAQDPANQVLEYWIAAAPRPRPPRSSWEREPAFREARRDLRMMYFLDPSLKAVHLMTPDGPEECRHLLQQSFTDDTFECNATIPSYSHWYARCEMGPSYRRHRDLLKLVGSTAPGKRWVLKYPAHMRHLKTLLEVYPDACIVQTHRDPGRVLPSLCSLIAGWRGLYEAPPDRRAIGTWQLELWASALWSAVELRRGCPSEQFFDLHFREVLEDPIGAARRVYAHFGFDWTPAAEERMRAWREEHPPGHLGEHRYRGEDFGFTSARLRERFGPYLDHFGIDPEPLP